MQGDMSIARVRHMGGVRVQHWRGRPHVATIAGWLLAWLSCGAVWAADPAGTPLSRAALAACDSVSQQPLPSRAALLDRTLKDAEQALASNEKDALAHFAVFCTLGERMQLDGVSLAAISNLRRLRREIDRTLELAPDFADALAGKGALLTDLPRVLGGDAAAGERVLRQALVVEPDYLSPRRRLAELLLGQGRRDEARHEAQALLVAAEHKQVAEDVSAARALLDRIGPAPH